MRSSRILGHDALSVEELDVLSLNGAAREQLREEMLAIHDAAYLGPVSSKRSYVEWVTDPKVFARYQRVALVRRGRRPVAYFHGFIRTLEVGGGAVEVIRSTAAALPDERAGGLIGQGFRRVAWHFAREHAVARGPRYIVGVCMSPVSYGMVARRSRCLFPSPVPATDPEIEQVHRAVHGETDRVQRPVSSLESRERLADARVSSDPYMRFYLEANPRFDEGFGLAFTARLNLGDTLYGLAAGAALALRRPSRAMRRG